MRVPIRSAKQAGAYLEGLINFERQPSFRYERLDLGPVRRLLDRLGHPERSLCVLHVAGSKGKGSTALLVESILLAAGEIPGTFTSPHLSSWTERFRIGGREVSGDALVRAVAGLRPHAEELRAEDPERAPTFFDATTAAALLLFAEARVDYAILEVGLGGRLDSTNVVRPAVTCITSIELEHTDKLGTTLSAIASEKAGILKPGVPCVLGPLPPEAVAVVRERARKLAAPLFRMGSEFRVDAQVRGGGPGVAIRYDESDGFRVEAELCVLGRHQAANAGVAIACARRLDVARSDRLPAAVRRAFAKVRLPGRIEILENAPWVIVDGAHTGASARALSEALASLPARRRHLVLSVSAGKDLPAILEAMLPGMASVTVTRAEPKRSLDPAEVSAAVRATAPGVEVRVVPNPSQAVRVARECLAHEDLLVVAGSVYLAGIARATLAPNEVTSESFA